MDFNHYFSFFIEAVVIFMSAFFFMQYTIIKRKEHLYYAAYLGVLAVYYLLALPQLFFPAGSLSGAQSELLEMFKRPVQFFSSVFYTLFVMHYLGLRQKSKKLFRLYKTILWIYVGLSVTCLLCNIFHVEYNSSYFLIGVLLFPLQLYMLIALFKGEILYSRFIIWGSIILLSGALAALLLSLYMMKHTGAGNVQTMNPFIPVHISILLDLFLFTMALQRKIADNEKSLINAAYTRQQAVLIERERIIADLHDDVGGGLSTIRMMSDLMADHQNHPEARANIGSYAQKISLTAKDIAQRMHTIIWSLNEENDTLQNFSEYLRQYGINFFEDTPISFNSSMSCDVPGPVQLSGVQRKNLFLIIKEAFHNMLKHSGGNQAEATISLLEGRLTIVIKDNGSGIDNHNQFGNGLKNMKKRMDEIGGTLGFRSDGGTVITLALPLGT
ncbi:MAG: hypothetical protein JWQ27_2434 [Ferruginibacter sp.]|nr:hypothetical protein [Ferruginibacter sp.]